MNPIPLPYKALAAVLLLIAAAFAGYRAGVKIERADWQAKEIDRQTAEKQAIIDNAENYRLLSKANEAKNRKVSEDYEHRLAVLRKSRDADRAARDADPANGLRIDRAVCDSTSARTETAGSSRIDDGASIRLPREIEENLFKLTEDAEIISEQLKALQAWVREFGFY